MGVRTSVLKMFKKLALIDVSFACLGLLHLCFQCYSKHTLDVWCFIIFPGGMRHVTVLVVYFLTIFYFFVHQELQKRLKHTLKIARRRQVVGNILCSQREIFIDYSSVFSISTRPKSLFYEFVTLRITWWLTLAIWFIEKPFKIQNIPNGFENRRDLCSKLDSQNLIRNYYKFELRLDRWYSEQLHNIASQTSK